jgi:hypothetical protein
MIATQLRGNFALHWDYRLGLRGAGLIVYGALPASLSALGVVKVPEQAALPLSVPSVPFIAVVALAPVVLTFVLTKQRMAAWYVLADYLWLRSILITLGIVVASTAVCLAARALTKPDIGAALHEWLGLALAKQANTVGHALLLSLAFLVGSSTLFLTVIKEDSGLPLLPAKDRLAQETELRKRLVETAAAARKWDPDPAGTLEARSNELGAHIVEARKAIASLKRLAPGLGRNHFYAQIEEELRALGEAIGEVRGAPQTAPTKYWANPPPHGLNKDENNRRTLVRRHAQLCVHA